MRSGVIITALKFLLLTVLVAESASAISNPPSFDIQQGTGTDQVAITTAAAGVHRIEIDDAPDFHTPVVVQSLQGSAIIHTREAGLVPGDSYYIRMDHLPPVVPLRVAAPDIRLQEVNCRLLRKTWEQTGRLAVGVAFSRLRWDTSNGRWMPIAHSAPIGEALYNAGLVLRPVLVGARGCGDLETIDEIAQYYLAMLAETETVATLLKRPGVRRDTIERLGAVNRVDQVNPRARTFAASFGGNEVGEGELYNSQWLYPASYLARLISLLPEERRTTIMKSFAARYTPFIVTENLDRYLVQQQLPALGGHIPSGRIEHWKLIMQGQRGALPWETAMSDIDLWLLASAAEMLGAHANDAALVPLNAQQLAMLHAAVDTGIAFFESKRTLYPETRNFNGDVVGSASYFNGDYTALDEFKYSAYEGNTFPAAGDQRVRTHAAWDMEHMYRVPVFMQALYENRKATRSAFPQYHDLELVVNQYVYRVFNGDYDRPLFHNNFDGSDGWFRVGFNGGGTAHPPSGQCSMKDATRLCMMPGTILGWPLLAYVNRDLLELQMALLRMGATIDASGAIDESSEKRAFRARFYSGATPFQVIMDGGERVYGGAFYFVVAENADLIEGSAEAAAKWIQ